MPRELLPFRISSAAYEANYQLSQAIDRLYGLILTEENTELKAEFEKIHEILQLDVKGQLALIIAWIEARAKQSRGTRS